MPKTVEKTVSYDLSLSLKKAELASSLPPPFYTSKTLAQQEIELFFRQSWIGVGRSDIVSAPGDYITLDVANQHIILLRDKKSKLRAFANTCRHRSARIIDGKGSCKGLRCPFHSWFYDLEGKLISAPDMINAVGFKKNNYGLIQYLAEERFGFVFVSIDRDATSIDDYLGNFADFHKSWPLERLVTVRRREIIVECNWKMFLEVFNEYYHLPFVHPNSVNSIYKKPKPADEVTGDFASQFGLTEGTGGLLEGSQDYALPDMPGLEGEAKIGARYTWLFPNITFAANKDAMWCYEAYPIAPNRCQVYQSACFPSASIKLKNFKEKAEQYFDRLDKALDEDIPALLNQQRGMYCNDALPGRFQPELESNVASFAFWYAGKW